MIEFTLLNVLILKLKIYCGPDKFYGRSKFGQYDEVKDRAPFVISFFLGGGGGGGGVKSICAGFFFLQFNHIAKRSYGYDWGLKINHALERFCDARV